MSGLETIGLGVITNLISDGIKKIKSPKKKSESKKFLNVFNSFLN